ncbi:MAG: hypothetical protein ACJAYB_001829 [Psychromonas sp.]|jgi:hypothetical protein
MTFLWQSWFKKKNNIGWLKENSAAEGEKRLIKQFKIAGDEL